MLMLPRFECLFVDGAIVPQSLHLAVGTVGEKTSKGLFQFNQVLLGVETGHHTQQFKLRRTERLSNRCSHNRIFLLFQFAKILFFSSYYHVWKNICSLIFHRCFLFESPFQTQKKDRHLPATALNYYLLIIIYYLLSQLTPLPKCLHCSAGRPRICTCRQPFARPSGLRTTGCRRFS